MRLLSQHLKSNKKNSELQATKKQSISGDLKTFRQYQRLANAGIN
jgi:hypothetical protein